MITEKSSAMGFLEDVNGEPLSFGGLLLAIREGEEMTQADFARQLGISRSHLCYIEKRRTVVSLVRAVQFAKLLGYSEAQFARLSLQSLVEQAGLDFRVKVEATSPSPPF